jgi:hypothetical protein
MGGVGLMAAIATKSDEQVLEQLDFPYKPGCDRKSCPMAATFVIQCRQCGASLLMCTTHFLETKHRCDAAAITVCSECKGHGHSFEQLCLVIPIGDRS